MKHFVILMALLVFPIDLLPQKISMATKNKVYFQYLSTLDYNSFSSLVKEKLSKTPFDKYKHRLVYVLITSTVKKKWDISACKNVSDAMNDPCKSGNKVIMIVSKNQINQIRKYVNSSPNLIYLFNAPVYTHYIEKGIHHFLVLY